MHPKGYDHIPDRTAHFVIKDAIGTEFTGGQGPQISQQKLAKVLSAAASQQTLRELQQLVQVRRL
jgi:hypothetical protein